MVIQAVSLSRKHTRETQILAGRWKCWKRISFNDSSQRSQIISSISEHCCGIQLSQQGGHVLTPLLAIAGSETGQLLGECFSINCSCYILLHHWIWGKFNRHAWMSVTFTQTSTKYVIANFCRWRNSIMWKPPKKI